MGVLFANSFLSYLLVFLVFIAAAVAGVFVGMNMRKRKDAKAAEEQLEAGKNE